MDSDINPLKLQSLDLECKQYPQDADCLRHPHKMSPTSWISSPNRKYGLYFRSNGHLELYSNYYINPANLIWKSNNDRSEVNHPFYFNEINKHLHVCFINDKLVIIQHGIIIWQSHQDDYVFDSDKMVLNLDNNGNLNICSSNQLLCQIFRNGNNQNPSQLDDHDFSLIVSNNHDQPSCSKGYLQQDSIILQNQYFMNSTLSRKLIMQSDGNLVLYDNRNRPLWASGSWDYFQSNEFYYCIIQSDGNLVIYNNKHKPKWASDTWNPMDNVKYQLTIKDNGLISIQMNDQTQQQQQQQQQYFSNVQYFSDIWYQGEWLQKFEKEFEINNVDRFSSHSDLQRGQFIKSENGQFYFGFLKNGCIVVLNARIEMLWNSQTYNQQNHQLKITEYGELRLFNQSGKKVWGVDQSIKKKGVYWMSIDNDGLFRILDHDCEHCIWSSASFKYDI